MWLVYKWLNILSFFPVNSNQVKVSIIEDGRGQDSPRMEVPNPVMVMLPVGLNEKRALQIQKSIQPPSTHEGTASGPGMSQN